MKFSLVLIITLTCLPLFSQEIDSIVFDEIYKRGKLYTKPLKNGEIDFLRGVTPPEDSWQLSKLEEYKQKLGSNDILYGVFIMPNNDETFYSYNLFAYDIKREVYYFVAIVSYKISESDVLFDNSYLFTEKQGLTNWWRSTFSFYESDRINKIPKEYVFDVCPPPPFRQ